MKLEQEAIAASEVNRMDRRIIQVDMAIFYTFRNGQVAQIREIIDSYDLVQQVLEHEIGPLIVGERVDGA